MLSRRFPSNEKTQYSSLSIYILEDGAYSAPRVCRALFPPGAHGSSAGRRVNLHRRELEMGRLAYKPAFRSVALTITWASACIAFKCSAPLKLSA